MFQKNWKKEKMDFILFKNFSSGGKFCDFFQAQGYFTKISYYQLIFVLSREWFMQVKDILWRDLFKNLINFSQGSEAGKAFLRCRCGCQCQNTFLRRYWCRCQCHNLFTWCQCQFFFLTVAGPGTAFRPLVLLFDPFDPFVWSFFYLALKIKKKKKL